MKEDLIKFKTAKLAKEKGFDIKVETFYMGDSEYNFLHNAGKKNNWNNHKCILDESELSDDYSAPTQSLLQKWLRELHNIHICVAAYADGYYFEISSTPKPLMDDLYSLRNRYKTYEQALEKGLFEALKLIK